MFLWGSPLLGDDFAKPVLIGLVYNVPEQVELGFSTSVQPFFQDLDEVSIQIAPCLCLILLWPHELVPSAGFLVSAFGSAPREMVGIGCWCSCKGSASTRGFLPLCLLCFQSRSVH